MIHTAGQLTLLEKEDLIQPRIRRIADGNLEDIKFFFDIFSDDIYNFPIRYYNFTDDDAAEFYLYAFEHLKNGKKISSFKFKSKFTTWFFTVLRNLVLDFLRKNRKKINILSVYKTDFEGNNINVIDNIADSIEKEIPASEENLLNNFKKKLAEMKIYNRVLFKLAYIHYTDLDEEEMEWLCQENQIDINKLKEILLNLKDIGLARSNEVRRIEDKLSANFQAIRITEKKIFNLFKENPSIKFDETQWHEEYQNPDYSIELNTLIQTMMKKKRRHAILLQSQSKSLLCTRLPYKEFSTLLKTTDGVLSVQLLRIIEKLNPS